MTLIARARSEILRHELAIIELQAAIRVMERLSDIDQNTTPSGDLHDDRLQSGAASDPDESSESAVGAEVPAARISENGETGMVLGTGKERPLSIGLHTDGDPEARFDSASLHQKPHAARIFTGPIEPDDRRMAQREIAERRRRLGVI